jgi:hypothetical protein
MPPCKKCGSTETEAKVAGDTSKNPGRKYFGCADCGQFIKWNDAGNAGTTKSAKSPGKRSADESQDKV